MPREIIVLQIGQCGNQIANLFWSEVYKEHQAYHSDPTTGFPVYDDAMSSFYYIEEQRVTRRSPPSATCALVSSATSTSACQLKARTIPIDMEEGVLAHIMRGPTRGFYDVAHFVSDTSGCGNNWAVGHVEYGELYAEQVSESVRRTTEPCDSLQTFFLFHSLGGGTGSGLGTRMLTLLQDEYPDVFRFSCVVAPQVDDDVVISPYNAAFALRELIQFADCAVPIDNQALGDLSRTMQRGQKRKANGAGNVDLETQNTHRRDAFSSMNALATRLLCDLTCSVRFPGSLNMDLNEITTNLVPYERMHFLLSGVSPLTPTRNAVDSVFLDSLEKSCQLLPFAPRGYRYLACGVVVRSHTLSMVDVHRNIRRMSEKMKLAHWNRNGFKVAMCGALPCSEQVPTPPVSLLTLSNNGCIEDWVAGISGNFRKLYHSGAHVHHYTPYLEQSYFEDTLDILDDLVLDYQSINQGTGKSSSTLSDPSLRQLLL